VLADELRRYLAVDYDRSTFAITPTPSQISGQVDLVTINHRNHSGLSSGAIAGIVVGCVVVLLAIIALVILWLKRQRRARLKTLDSRRDDPRLPQMSESMPDPLRTFYETDGKPKAQAQSPEFGPAYPKAELHGSQPDHRA
jgi:tetrahydromethanopterin S-methyltransferase subunit F